jgi:CMP/dCMP kinase
MTSRNAVHRVSPRGAIFESVFCSRIEAPDRLSADIWTHSARLRPIFVLPVIPWLEITALTIKALYRKSLLMIIAIDGPAASGKGTLGKRLAHHYGYRHLDTGVIYRAVAWSLMQAGADPGDELVAVAAALELDPEKFGNPILKTQKVGDAASVVSAIPKVREVLLNFQRQFAADPPGAVLDGRDIGTVICPHADVKIFVVADPQVRARRRTLEARARGEEADEAAVLADILKRDERDRNRAVAPLKPAADAHTLDNSNLDIEAGVRAAIEIVEAVRAGRKPAL